MRILTIEEKEYVSGGLGLLAPVGVIGIGAAAVVAVASTILIPFSFGLSIPIGKITVPTLLALGISSFIASAIFPIF